MKGGKQLPDHGGSNYMKAKTFVVAAQVATLAALIQAAGAPAKWG